MLKGISVPVRDTLVFPDKYTATKVFEDYMMAVVRAIPTLQPLVVTDFGARGSGADDTRAFQNAIDAAAKQGGGSLVIPSGTYSIGTLTIPAGDGPIELIGQGDSSVLKRIGGLDAGKGLIDILRSNVSIGQLAIDGDVTTATGLFYNQDFLTAGVNDPMADCLTRNTSVWVHGPASNFRCDRVTWQHTGGYALLLDCQSGSISDVQIVNCRFLNNRPHLFGAPGGNAIFGSWTGGIFVKGDGRASNPGSVLKRMLVMACTWRRNTGNCFWQHLYALDELHEEIVAFGNLFEDCGLDGILIGGVTGGAVNSNVFRRVGYVCESDTARAVPRWLTNVQATALDSSGLVKGVMYANNSFLSINGGCMDLDCHGDSAIIGNACRIPFPDEMEYEEDQIAIIGPNNNGSASYGINLGNTNNTLWGGRNVQISGNTFINFRLSAIRLYSARNCHVSSNTIIVPDAPLAPPIVMGPGGTGVNQRSSGNVIRGNVIQYSPASAAPAVFEDPAVDPLVATDVNHVFGNCPILGNGNAVEFQKDPNSGSIVYGMQVWFP